MHSMIVLVEAEHLHRAALTAADRYRLARSFRRSVTR
jgi:hypothetical protein